MFGPESALTVDAIKVSHPSVPPTWGVFPRFAFQLLSDTVYSSVSISAIEVFQEVSERANYERAKRGRMINASKYTNE